MSQRQCFCETSVSGCGAGHAGLCHTGLSGCVPCRTIWQSARVCNRPSASSRASTKRNRPLSCRTSVSTVNRAAGGMRTMSIDNRTGTQAGAQKSRSITKPNSDAAADPLSVFFCQYPCAAPVGR